MSGYKLDHDELTSEGWLGMTWAIHNFDLDKGFRFGTYARSIIVRSLYTYVVKNFFISNVCTTNKNKKIFFKLRQLVANELKQKTSLSQEWYERTAANFGVDVDKLKMMNSTINSPYQSLNTPLSDDTTMSKLDILVSHYALAEEDFSNEQTTQLGISLINNALSTLDDRTKDIVVSQLLQNDDQKETLETLGLRYNISKERVRQIRITGVGMINENITNQMEQHNIVPSDLLVD